LTTKKEIFACVVTAELSA